jgi:hypothetical protein
MNNPRPVPENDFEVNLENNFGKSSESMPGPLSLILTITLFALPSSSSSTTISFSKLIDIVPPC